jgi:hypothetical protein
MAVKQAETQVGAGSRTHVRYIFPGVNGAEVIHKVDPSRNVEEAIRKLPNSAIGFSFFDGNVETVDGERNFGRSSPTYWPDATVYTLEQIRRGECEEARGRYGQILAEEMESRRGNPPRVVRTRTGTIREFNEGDEVVSTLAVKVDGALKQLRDERERDEALVRVAGWLAGSGFAIRQKDYDIRLLRRSTHWDAARALLRREWPVGEFREVGTVSVRSGPLKCSVKAKGGVDGEENVSKMNALTKRLNAECEIAV